MEVNFASSRSWYISFLKTNRFCDFSLFSFSSKKLSKKFNKSIRDFIEGFHSKVNDIVEGPPVSSQVLRELIQQNEWHPLVGQQ